MLKRLASLFDEAPDPEPVVPDDEALHMAAAALFIEAARMDDTVDEAERSRIVTLMAWRFELAEDEAEAIVEKAEASAHGSVQWHGFAETIRKRFGPEDRLKLVELMWDVACADGEIHDLEAHLMRRIAGHLHVSDQDSGAARKRAMARHGMAS